jgi:hypothetical protein
MKLMVYDIFSGLPSEEPLWLQSVEGLEAACARMRERADAAPGHYFVFCSQTQKVLASADTSHRKKAVEFH